MKMKNFDLKAFGFLLALVGEILGQQFVLTPPYFNIAENRPVRANATCGIGFTPGRPERYCKLVGYDREEDTWGLNRNKKIVYGQICDDCYAPGTDGVDPAKTHGPENAVDGDISTWWQSPPISRGNKYNRVDLEIDLLQTFQVAYVVVTMAGSPRPGVWALEKSLDSGKTWTAWQYFAGSDAECQKYFGVYANLPITRDDDVICTTDFSKVLPIEGGEIFVALTQGRPNSKNVQNSPVMMNWLRATNIRLRLLQTKTMLGHLMSVRQQDDSVTNRYYYAIKEISVGGRCVCNGHAYICPPSPLDPLILECDCLHNTAGLNCDKCKDGYTQKAWRRHTKVDMFECEKCNCNGHSDKCHYNQTIADLGKSMDIHGEMEGGGVCEECKDHTTGINCQTCEEGYYRPIGVAPDAPNPCIPCDCGDDPRYTGSCAAESGQCECKEAFRGAEDCSECASGFYDYPECKPCDCFPEGTLMDESGVPVCVSEGSNQCPCNENFGGQFCDECAPGYYNFPECKRCECNPDNSLDLACDQFTGQCNCDERYKNRTCTECNHGFFNYPDCSFCNCDPQGTEEEICDKNYGDCMCKDGYGGERCDRCSPGWYGYPECKQCECSKEGSRSDECNQETGQCTCYSNFGGRQCDSCTPGYYNYPNCDICGCDNFGSRGQSCDDDGKCSCLTNFMGFKCDKCAPERFNFPLCEECNCNPEGVADDFFNQGGCANVPKGELCSCKEKVTGRTCNECKPLYWNLQKWRPDGCESCECYRPGTIGGLGVCDQEDGQCLCKPTVDGDRKCDQCKDGFYQLSGNNMIGCSSCNCDVGGTDYPPATTPECSKEDGQCNCRYGMVGRQCNEVQSLHYIPNLFQHKFEIEDGYRLDGSLVRFAYDPSKFPNFSWRGYASYSPLQKQVLQEISITKSSSYRMVMRYQNPNAVPITGVVRVSKVGSDDDALVHEFVLDPTSGDPDFATISGAKGIYPSLFDLEPGQWTVSVEMDNPSENDEVLIDYFVLLPGEFTDPSILRHDVTEPCLRDGSQAFCRQYIYPMVDMYPNVDSKDALNPAGAGYYPYTGRPEDLKEVGVEHVVQIANYQPELKWVNKKNKEGPHAVVIGYFTPEPTNGTNIGVSAGQGTPGEAYIYDCPYSQVCRQVVTDPEGRIAIFDLPRKETGISVRALAPDTNVAIDKIYLIPIEDWNPAFVTPFSKCVKDKSGDCLKPKRFPLAPDGSVTLTPAIDGTESLEKPRYIAEPDTPLLKIGGGDDEAHLAGDVPQEGAYIIVAQYYQPDYPSVDAKVVVSDGSQDRAGGDQLPSDIFNVYEAVLPLPTCASPTGCRQPVLKAGDDNTPAEFKITETLDIKLNTVGPNEGWIEYVMAVPVEEYDDKLLHSDDSVNRQNEFINECGQNSFYIPDNVEDGFCKETIISVSSDFNNGALECGCNADGSVDKYRCQPFGGQCDCKPNVIGRSCERCEPGFFGFPECKECKCPSTATCNEDTGDCICAPFVTGTEELPCSECEENTFGYDPITGCQECKCMVEGTLSGNMSCTQDSGQCYCKENVEGRTCDHCSYGSYQYPDCQSCDCDLAGTVEMICNQETAECMCKESVTGPRCDECMDGHFNLQSSNPDGCTECFCFGKSTQCSSKPGLFKNKFEDMNGWIATQIEVKKHPEITELEMDPLTNYGGILDINFDNIVLGEQEFYFSSPPSFAASRVSSFGSDISYNITTYGDSTQGNKKSPDMIIMGADSFIFFFSGKKVGNGERIQMHVPLEPRYWVHPSGNPVTRPQLMLRLNNLQRVFIRGSYAGPGSQQTRLENVILEYAEEVEDGEEPVLTVEQCVCPEGYTGSSCELCAPGFFTESSDQWGPICRRCNCHGHADTCHPTTGECATFVPVEPLQPEARIVPNFCHFNPDRCAKNTTVNHCRDNTRGRNCELCEVGFYGDATSGSPDACQSCPCPLPDNNFADSCDGLFDTSLDPSQQVCVCKPNYVGDTCDRCGPGYFGNPNQPDGFCQTCSCNGNIDTSDEQSCDHLTGLCQLCLYDTFGDSCERCKPWFFGDAVTEKNCAACDCDRDGTQECDHVTGQCKCFPGVEGDRCDRCKADHFGFQYGGCTECECSEASIDTQCDLETGQCLCAPGVTGAKCGRCMNGFWNLGSNGCESCGCNTEFAVGGGCNQVSGQCECLPGVVGQNCDHCPPNWILIMSETRTNLPEWKIPFDYEEGCFPCSSCVVDLMDSLNEVIEDLAPIMEEFKETETSYFAYKRLNFIDKEIDQQILGIALLDPVKANRRIKPLADKINSLLLKSNSLNVDFKLNLMKELTEQSDELSVDGSNAVAEMGEVGVKIMKVIEDVNSVSKYLAEGAPTKELLDTSIKKGRELLAAMQGYNFSPVREKVVAERELARTLDNKIKEWATPFNKFKDTVNETLNSLAAFESNIDDLHNQTKTADIMASEAIAGNWRTTPQAQTKITRINQLNEDAKKKLESGRKMIEDGENFNNAADNAYGDLSSKNDEMDTYSDRFSNNQREFENERNTLFDLDRQAAIKADELESAAAELKNIAEKSKLPAQNALQAAMSYEKILSSITEAEEMATSALDSADESLQMSDGVATKVNNAMKDIERMYEDALNAEATVDNELEPILKASTQQVDDVNKITKEIKQKLGVISKQVEKMGDLSDVIEETKEKASTAQTDAHYALTSINARAKGISDKKANAYNLRDEYAEMNLHLDNTEKALADYEDSPNRKKREAYQEQDINTRLQLLEEKKNYIIAKGGQVNDLVGSIRDKIGSVRDILSEITNPGVTFTTGSNLELQTPQHIEDLALKTDVSFYTNISDKAETDFLFYMGNLEETYKLIPTSLTDDFMAIQVNKEGLVTLIMDLGAGPQTITSEVPVVYNDWMKIDVNRVGSLVNLTLSFEKEIGNIQSETVTYMMPAMNAQNQPTGSVFNLNKEYSKIFVGGFPTEQKVQGEITSTDMEGQIEGLMIGGKSVGLWNLKRYERIEGASSRNKFTMVASNEGRFKGDGYISLDTTNFYTEGESSSISLRIRPDSGTGLIFHLYSDLNTQQFLSLELDAGYLLFKFGDAETVEVRSSIPLELNKWYNIRLDRTDMIGGITLDGTPVARNGVEGAPAVFQMMTNMYVGGRPDSAVGYSGCVDEVRIEPDLVELQKNLESKNFAASCTMEVKNTVSFSEATPGYVKMPDVYTPGSLTTSFAFRTNAVQGLLLYMVDSTNQFYVSLSMRDGALHLYAHPDNEVVTLDMKNNPTVFNDNKWHIVSVSIEQEPEYKIVLQIDDYYVVAPHEVSNIPLVNEGTQYSVYFGGLPESLSPLRSGVAAHEGPFIGCIRDAIVVNNYQDFQNAEAMAGASLGECGSKDIVTIEPVDKAEVEKAEDDDYTAADEFDPRDLFDKASEEAPTVFGNCKLPTSPAYDVELSSESGFRFGMKSSSYIEYVKKKMPEQVKEKTRFDMEFKTTHDNGLIMFMKDDLRSDFFALFVKDGRLVFSFDCGSGPSRLETDFKVNDGQWHTVDISRIDNEGKLVFDSREVKVQDLGQFSFSNTKIMEVSPHLFLGGLSDELREDVDIKRKLEFNSFREIPGFIGCLRKVRVEITRNNKRKMRPLGRWQNNSFVIPCSDKVEPGYFFGPEGGRIKAFRRFRVGIDFDVSMMIKPRNSTGLLLAVRGRRDMAILQMVDGAIQFMVDNGRGPIAATFKPTKPYQFCDGEWHEIHAVKMKNVVTLSVNKIFAQPGIGVPGVSSTDTNNPLFLGGHPYPQRIGLGPDQYVPFIGCMRDVVIEGQPLDIKDNMLYGDIHSHVCPTI